MYELNDTIRELGEKVIEERAEFAHLRTDELRIIYLSCEKKRTSRGKNVYADTEKISDKVKAVLPADFIITFYRPCCEGLSEENMEKLMIHEMKHIGYESGKPCFLIPHDVEDFSDMIETYGMKWIL